METEAFAKQNHREGNRLPTLKKAPGRIGDPLRPSSPPGFRPDGRNGLPENRRNPGRTRASRKKDQRKMNKEDEIADSREGSGAKTQQPPPTPKGREKSGIGVGQRCVGRAISWRWSQSPLWTSRRIDAESVPDGKSGKRAQKRLRQPLSGKDLPTRWAASKAVGCFLQLI
ncbi:hypothetical protein HFO45_10965 [Rhizobium leguminosarum]|uniref:hypothetical protein n=1 Tax=Rhizobium leguminosarum TaxID=384 RepID=UPI001C9661D1|nr:hypothetical protein [Rhizobium leguminosarum]MBY5648775.1 hypothetical protein [Rhizobium leguminosarum]